MEKSRNLGLDGASSTEWQLITPRGGPCGPPPIWYRVKNFMAVCWFWPKGRPGRMCNSVLNAYKVICVIELSIERKKWKFCTATFERF